MENKELINCTEMLQVELNDDEVCVSVTIANKIKVQIGEDFYIFDEEGEVGYVKFRGLHREVGDTIRKIKKCITKNKRAFAKLLEKND